MADIFICGPILVLLIEVPIIIVNLELRTNLKIGLTLCFSIIRFNKLLKLYLLMRVHPTVVIINRDFYGFNELTNQNIVL